MMAVCVVCGAELIMRSSLTKKKQTPFIEWLCPVSPAHFHAFINDDAYVRHVLSLSGRSEPH